MNRFLIAAVILSAAFIATAANAGSLKCSEPISAEGMMTNVEGSSDHDAYGGRVPKKLAEKRAIQNWQDQVRANCPDYSWRWWRANSPHVDCDAGMGHVYCTAVGKPQRKYLSMIFN